MNRFPSAAPVDGWRPLLPWSRAGVLLLALGGLAGCQPAANTPTPSAAPNPASAAASAASAASTPAVPPGSAPKAASPTPAGPPVSVTVVAAQRQRLPVLLETNGVVTSQASVELRPQVAGQVSERLVAEGQTVRKAQLLFRLDARAEEAGVARARAQLAQSQAALADARRQLERALDLQSRQFVSQGSVDAARTLAETATAAAQAAEASLRTAEVSLSHTRLEAPFDGRVGAINAVPGTAVSPTGAALLTLTRMHPVSVSFGIPQRNLPEALKALKAPTAQKAAGTQEEKGAGAVAEGGPGTVTVELPDRRGQRQGRLEFVDNTIEGSSGTVRLKAELDNRDQLLWPGAYVTVRLALGVLEEATVVPVAALVEGARGRSVFIAQADGTAANRPVQVLHTQGELAAVSGIEPGDRVVLDGRQNVRNGSKLQIREAPKPARSTNSEPKTKAAP